MGKTKFGEGERGEIGRERARERESENEWMNINILWEVLSSICEMRLTRLSLFPNKNMVNICQTSHSSLTSSPQWSFLLVFFSSPHPQTHPEMGQYQPFSTSTTLNSSITLCSQLLSFQYTHTCVPTSPALTSGCLLVLSSFDLLLINLLPLPS